jgi:hypothetical protein
VTPLEEVAKHSKSMPDHYIDGVNNVTDDFRSYAKPLVGSLPVHEKIYAPEVSPILKK